MYLHSEPLMMDKFYSCLLCDENTDDYNVWREDSAIFIIWWSCQCYGGWPNVWRTLNGLVNIYRCRWMSWWHFCRYRIGCSLASLGSSLYTVWRRLTLYSKSFKYPYLFGSYRSLGAAHHVGQCSPIAGSHVLISAGWMGVHVNIL